MSSTLLPSDRSFGTLFVVVFLAVAGYVWWLGSTWYGVPLGLSVLTLAVTLIRPNLLRPFNRWWMQLAVVLNRVVSPLVLGLIFFGMFTPIALAMRMAGRDTMKRKFDAAVTTYWIDRQPPGPDPKGLPNQF